MEKYFAVISNSIKKNLVYRMNNLISMVSILLSFAVLFYFWNSIYRQGNQIGTYTLKEMISYYIYVTIFQLLVTGDNTAWTVGEEIRNGQIVSSILKPISYLKYKAAQSWGNLIYRLTIFLPVILIAVFSLKNYLVNLHNFTIMALFLLCAIVSYVLFFLVYFAVGIAGFWTGESKSLFWVCWVIINFMQGGTIPLDLLPKWFSTLSQYLPFKYLFFVPVSLATGRINFSYDLIAIPVAWCLFLYVTAQFLFVRGLKKYEGFGI